MEENVIREATESIRIIPDSAINLLQQMKEAQQSGTVIDEIDYEFIYNYALVETGVAILASAILEKGSSLDELHVAAGLELINLHAMEVQAQAPIAYSAEKSHHEWLTLVNERIKTIVAETAQGENRLGQMWSNYMAYNLAIGALSNAIRRRNVVNNLKQRWQEVEEHRQLMKAARSRSDKEIPTDQPIDPNSLHEGIFLSVLEAKYQMYGVPPQLITIHDIDGNLLETEFGKDKPGNALSDQVDELDSILGSSAYLQRLQIIDGIYADPIFGDVATELFKAAGKGDLATSTRRIRLFKDARDAVHSCIEAGIDVQFLTANMHLFAEGVLKRFGQIGVELSGMSASSEMSKHKNLCIAEIFLEKGPNVVIVISDDNDGSLARAIAAGTVVSGLDSDLPIEELCFFAARVAGEQQKIPVRVSAALQQKNISFSANLATEAADGEINGYQGMYNLIKRYNKWKEQHNLNKS